MAQKKLKRFAELKSFPNVFEYPENMQGKWDAFFGNPNPVTLELACGKGEYAVGLGRLYPNRNFIGVDIKGNRMWKGAKTAIEEGLKNVGFLRSQVERINEYFKPGEVSEIWITFPDPQLRVSRAKKRLTHPRFLRLYQQILATNGTINLKTDSPDLYDFTLQVAELYGLEIVHKSANVYASGPVSNELAIKTHYEGLDIAKSSRIFYIRFSLDGSLPVAKDDVLKQLVIQNESAETN
ncbi:tRNA (guanosine(46)-N7)-methyltransferase TrmB [Segetibacter sp. 3557_3]|uniref:tRNA (guanosine(46)-N7)-methyltransferase TrmB n=1 Tax=Segetibacter sp. 3557_3 TaxID=2547429 RepID=UPI0010590F43|nr:tRNA (guanosine(46)-N7)-methyltransferase TrmB [Segetibacter sp. 3557_3]TDH24036.1 tRNA (guanosine(46)-N7)-methyltransferase TrmB [Segetibacter sp. 3557_3]